MLHKRWLLGIILIAVLVITACVRRETETYISKRNNVGAETTTSTEPQPTTVTPPTQEPEPTTPPEETLPATMRVRENVELRVRERADINSLAVGMVYAGDQLTILNRVTAENNETWYEISYVVDNVTYTGFVAGEFLE